MSYKLKVKHPNYSLVLCDLSGAEVRTACNASEDHEMVRAYQSYDYILDTKEKNYLDLNSYDIIKSNRGELSVYILEEGDIIYDEQMSPYTINKKEIMKDKIRIYF